MAPSWDFLYDPEELTKLSTDQLWDPDNDPELLNGFAMMCAVQGRQAWLRHAGRLRPLVDDPDPKVAQVVLAALDEFEQGR